MGLVALGMWDLPSSGIEPVFPALAGKFFTTEPLGKRPPHPPAACCPLFIHSKNTQHCIYPLNKFKSAWYSVVDYRHDAIHQISTTNFESTMFLENIGSLVEEGSLEGNDLLLIWQVRDQICITVMRLVELMLVLDGFSEQRSEWSCMLFSCCEI